MAGDLPITVPVGEHPAQSVQRLAHGITGGKWPVIACSILLHAPDDADFGEVILPVDLDVRIGFIILQPDVEARPVALDQFVLQDQRFQLGVGDDPFQIGDLADQPERFGVMPGTRLKVRTHAVA